MTRYDVDRRVVDRARRQHGVVTTTQALALGASHGLISRRVASGIWLRLDSGLIALRGNPATWKRQAKAAELGHPAAAVSGQSAGVLHELPDFRPGRIEVTIPHAARYRSMLAVVRRRDGVTTTSVDGIRVTTLPQTLLDIAANAGAVALGRAVEDVILRGRVPADDLARCCLDASRRRINGAGRFREELDRLLGSDPPSDTELDRLLRRAISLAGLGPVVFQAPPPWWPGGSQRVDALLADDRVIVEADGRAWHARAEDFERDRWRDNQAALHDHRVVRLTWTMLTRDLPATVALLRELPAATARPQIQTATA